MPNFCSWYHWLNGCEFEWTLGVGIGQGDLAYCNSWGHKEWDMTEQLNRTESRNYFQKIYGGESLWWVRSCNIMIWQEKLVLEFCVNFKQCLHEKEGMVWEVTGGQHFCLLFWTNLVVKEISMLLLGRLTLHSIIIIII